MKILVSGATGYVGSRLIRVWWLRTRSLVYGAGRLARGPASGREHSHCGCRRTATGEHCRSNARNRCCLYLIHSMSASGGDFQERDRLAAHNFAVAARQAGVSRIIYLGGLASETSEISLHLKSRHETGEALPGSDRR